jgi:two-component sensor histidine kinase
MRSDQLLTLPAVSPLPSRRRSSTEALAFAANHSDSATNSLQLALGLLKRQAQRSASSIARADLMVAVSQLSSVILAHRRLSHAGQAGDVDISKYLGELVDELSATLDGAAHVTFGWMSSCAILFVPSVLAMRLGLVVTELLTNFAKHSGAGHSCWLALSSGARSLELKVFDDGPDHSADLKLWKRESTDVTLVEALCASLGGTVASPAPGSDVGASVVVTVPLASRAQAAPGSVYASDEAEDPFCGLMESDRMLVTALAQEG